MEIIPEFLWYNRVGKKCCGVDSDSMLKLDLAYGHAWI